MTLAPRVLTCGKSPWSLIGACLHWGLTPAPLLANPRAEDGLLLAWSALP
jgi:hypothetical protein